jgi:prepilin-type N-terminal cleavage/methylation domain-containing protein
MKDCLSPNNWVVTCDGRGPARHSEHQFAGPRVPVGGRAFSLIELLVVMLVVLILTGLLLPTLVNVREHARRVYCKSNLHQIGLALSMYANDHKDWLPESKYGDPNDTEERFSPQDMMATHRGEDDPEAWDGLGLLYRHDYCDCAQCFYCPSHHGFHDIDEYQQDMLDPGERQIFGNYHYAGHLVWETQQQIAARRKLEDGHRVVLVTDGLRSALDFNHRVGMNVLRGDISVIWQGDQEEVIYNMLPTDPEGGTEDDYAALWQAISAAEQGPSSVTQH